MKMDPSHDRLLGLRKQIASLEGLLADLKAQLTNAEADYNQMAPAQLDANGNAHFQTVSVPSSQPVDRAKKTFASLIDQLELLQGNKWGKSWELTSEEYKRYGRQLIMPEIGLRGQLRLKSASILIVGVGGLGCPAATYLAGAGVGEIGLMDADIVELSNLHRQLLHTEKWLGLGKVESARKSLVERNSENCYTAHHYNLDQKIAVETMRDYDLILDCTDRPSTRYLVSDAAVLAGKPVVTASALRTEGQLMVLNNPPRSHNNTGGFCYRCVFPKPPPAESVLSCGDGGILGPVVGVMGVLMAMEALKILVPIDQEDESQHPAETLHEPAHPSLLLYSAYSNPPFRSIKLRGKRKGCPSCSDTATITEESFKTVSSDYAAFCTSTSPAAAAAASTSDTNRISAEDYSKVRDDATSIPHILVDVREKVQFDICHLKGSISIPYSDISRDPEASIDRLDDTLLLLNKNNNNNNSSNPEPADDTTAPLYLICRYGNDSQLAANALRTLPRFKPDAKYTVKGDIAGGLRAWRMAVDPDFPEY